MRKRTHEIKLRLNDAELKHLNDMVSKSIYKREVFLRFLLNGYVMQEYPKDYIRFQYELINLSAAMRNYRYQGSLSKEERDKLLCIAEEIREVVQMMKTVYFPYYKEKKEKYAYDE